MDEYCNMNMTGPPFPFVIYTEVNICIFRISLSSRGQLHKRCGCAFAWIAHISLLEIFFIGLGCGGFSAHIYPHWHLFTCSIHFIHLLLGSYRNGICSMSLANGSDFVICFIRWGTLRSRTVIRTVFPEQVNLILLKMYLITHTLMYRWEESPSVFLKTSFFFKQK